ncbi:integrase [Mesorhizobium hawassense]|uniref:Integrase n=1 Tax=Mesorhizobium hawassense TaxID=1209954 RepID=A0A330HWZ1_9HYPH|nr:site-specific integrase [Mesorhizobium hawassense]RAZ91524.1 integrase [Mesorhizobium hawassense]
MAKLTKRTVDTTEIRLADYVIWDEELPGFGLRAFASGKKSYVVQYRAAGRSRRYTIGLHGVWTPEEARREAKVLLGQVARGGNPAEERKLDREAITVKELCTRYLEDLRNGLVLGKRGRPKKATTISTDVGRIERHIVPLLGRRRVRDLAKSDITQAMKDIMGGKTRANVKTEKLRGRAIVRGGAGTASRTIGLFGGILTYAGELGIIEQNPVHGVRKPKDQVNARRLSEQEYRTLGDILRKAAEDGQYETTAAMIRVIALTGCRRSEVIGLRWSEVDIEGSCLRLADSKEGASVRPIGLPALEYLEERRDEEQGAEDYVFPGWEDGMPFGSFPRQWTKLLKDTDLADITPHVLRHSFASIGNDLGFTEATIAALVGHSRGTVTSRYIHTVDTALIMAADSIAGYIQGLLNGVAFTHTAYALDRDSRKAALALFLGEPTSEGRVIQRSAA